MKLILENWRKYLKEEVFYVNISRLLPTEEMGHGKAGFEDYKTESAIKEKMQKPVNPYRLQGKPPMEKTGQAEPFYFVLNGHHRLAAAHRLGIVNIPVVLNKLEEQ